MGVVRKMEFEFANKDWNMIAFRLRSTPQMKQSYPYEFELTIEYRLIGKEIIVNYYVKNLDLKTMPFAIGGHPGFNCPMVANEKFEDYYIEFEQEETGTIPTPISATGLIDARQRTPFLNDQRELPLAMNCSKKMPLSLMKLDPGRYP